MTKAGEKAKVAMFESEADVSLWVETHLDKNASQNFAKQAAAQGMTATVAPSLKNQGGAALLAKSHLVQRAMPSDSAQEKWWEAAAPNIVAKEVPTKEGDIILAASYHRGGIDSEILKQMEVLTQGGERDFILFGDFNAPCQDEQLCTWMKKVAVEPLLAGQGAPTCTPSRGAPSTIDFAVMSARLLCRVRRFDISWCVPWAPHAKLRMWITRKSQRAKGWCLAAPPKIPAEIFDEDKFQEIWKDKEAEAEQKITEEKFAKQTAEEKFTDHIPEEDK